MKLPWNRQIVVASVKRVAPLAGAWIETKMVGTALVYPEKRVAPLAGAWIETPSWYDLRRRLCRPPRGGVD